MTEEDAIHFHRLCELRGELVRTKKELEDTQKEIARLKFHNENLEAAVKATKLDRELYLALELKDDLHQGELAQAFDELDKMKQEVAKLLSVPERYIKDQN